MVNSKLKTTIKEESGIKHLALDGVIDEDSELPDPGMLIGNQVVINFDRVIGINSLGVRKWFGFVKSLMTGNTEVVYEACHSSIVLNLCMSPALKASVIKIKSLYVDLVCPECDNEKSEIFKLDDVIKDDFPKYACDKCQNNMQVEDEMDMIIQYVRT